MFKRSSFKLVCRNACPVLLPYRSGLTYSELIRRKEGDNSELDASSIKFGFSENSSKSDWTADCAHKMCCADHLPEVVARSEVIGDNTARLS